MAKLEQQLADHLKECGKAAQRNDDAHDAILVAVEAIKDRLERRDERSWTSLKWLTGLCVTAALVLLAALLARP